ncbi:HpcH/HpaI aldolase/citrate lyase family protein [Subtercola endophyticus]|uniref:HpcH/HpaI aldolase/citrate lyase family protein n=1 Tax=Subtercola endophyticus TaxID=2895559 RepID=UPI001E5FAB80|nr:CoA ester lyase [Subtercola endophyticus]UFS58099.1 CoA ester lyase [Subtercola endophyticus]
MTARADFATMTSLIEVPILNPKYWSKVPEVQADAIMLDLEDSATPANKAAVRSAIIEALGDMSYFGGRRVIVRCNNLATPWGRDDLEALGAVSADIVVSYPKVERREELDEVAAILAAAGNAHPLHVMIETARALIEIDSIASHEAVAGLHFGYVDFAADVGSRPFDANGELSMLTSGYARSKIAIAAAAYGLFATGGSLIPDYKDLDKVRALIQSWSDLGYTACIAVSPAHLPIINEVMRPSAAEVAKAKEVVEAYEEATAKGDPAAVLNGRVITLPDYRVAELLLKRA